MLHVIGEYVRLARMHSSVLTGLTGLFGTLAMNPELEMLSILAIFFVGLFVHIYGFVLNEYFDMEIDRQSKDLSEKPLVSGAITPTSALAFCIISAVLSYVILFAAMKFTYSLWPFLFLSLTLAIFYAYDRWGKKLMIADVLLAGFVGFLCLAGASMVGWPLNAFALLIAALAFLQLFLQNAMADMKDVSDDREGGALTTAIRLDVRVERGTSRFIIPKKFQNYILSVKFIHIIIIFGFLFLDITGKGYSSFQFITIILAVMIMLTLISKILTMKTFERERLLRLIGAHELATYAAIPLLFINILSLLTVILFIIFPILWLACFMILMYGRLLPRI